MSPAASEPKRTRPMEILVFGLSRTGTSSMKLALEKLGYVGVYHMAELTRNLPNHANKWLALLKQKYEGNGQALVTREQFDEILGSYSALTDLPAICFASELITAYPTAKIILTTRSSSSWYTCMISTIYESQTDPLLPFVRPFLPAPPAAIVNLLEYIFHTFFMNDFPRFGRGVFERHNELVRLLAKEREQEGENRFLDFKVEEGWEPLCAFLGKEVPREDYPRTNDTKAWRASFPFEAHKKLRRIKLGSAVVIPVLVECWWVLRSGKGKLLPF